MKNLVKKAAAASSAKKDATPVAAASAEKTAGKAVAGAKGKKKKIGSQDMVSAILVLAGGAASLATIMLGFEALNK